MFEDNRWRRMLRPGITAIVGAGGKTTVLERLGKYGHGGNLPIMVSSIVPMDSARVDNVEPFDVICTEDVEKGEAFCAERIRIGHVPAWFRGLDGQDRYIGLDSKIIDGIKKHHPAWYILVESDEADHKWLKAPLPDDIPLPDSCDTVIGVVNLQMLGSSLSPEKVEGVDTAAAIMGRDPGAVITPSLLAKLIKHPRGMFRGANCTRVLFCTGYNAVQHRMTEALLDDLEDLGLSASVLADGYRESCTIRQYISYGDSKK
ncbi:MAG: putative selenium-dependent hydroxylase accessory protein YqeC [Megasphaera sp.]|jgi:probable selenium-dependent hydroxylase accessory protein YqeC|nr:putative selenium-dependent hydroxylase accessory protein YqeC [Megasphaera sp.]MCH4188460.1 putative selenium-dependent hydroxylase accessory protein YqeC [Megasphaera sp.]MCH4218238.1 putative selenium-dependent hydroxylase accessory protein YqeC [Megasphaera sp.]